MKKLIHVLFIVSFMIPTATLGNSILNFRTLMTAALLTVVTVTSPTTTNAEPLPFNGLSSFADRQEWVNKLPENCPDHLAATLNALQVASTQNHPLGKEALPAGVEVRHHGVTGTSPFHVDVDSNGKRTTTIMHDSQGTTIVLDANGVPVRVDSISNDEVEKHRQGVESGAPGVTARIENCYMAFQPNETP